MRKKVLIIGPCLSMGGIERAFVNTANSFNEAGLEVVLVSIFNKPYFFSLNKNIFLEEPNGFNNKNLSLVKTILWIKKLIKNHKPDRVLVFNKFYGAITAVAMIGSSIPFYISERSSPLFVWKQPIKAFNRIAYWFTPPTGVLAQTSFAATYQNKYFRKSKIRIIPNILREVKTYPEIDRKEVILAVGRLGDHLKGFDLLIESFALLKNKEWELHIAGGDEDGQELKYLATKLGVLKRIKFLGRVKDIDKIYASAGVFVIPSRSEGFPNALAEAMAAGCACVAFDFVAGPQDIVEHDVSGLIIENGNVKALSETLDYLIDNPIKREELGANAKEIRKVLDEKVISEKIIKFLNLDI